MSNRDSEISSLVLTFRHDILDLFNHVLVGDRQEFIFSVPAGGSLIFTIVTALPDLVGIQEVTGKTVVCIEQSDISKL